MHRKYVTPIQGWQLLFFPKLCLQMTVQFCDCYPPPETINTPPSHPTLFLSILKRLLAQLVWLGGWALA